MADEQAYLKALALIQSAQDSLNEAHVVCYSELRGWFGVALGEQVHGLIRGMERITSWQENQRNAAGIRPIGFECRRSVLRKRIGD